MKEWNIAAVEHVPLVVVATNNHYAYSTPNDREFACANLVDLAARGYGFEGYELDGTDLAQCLGRNRHGREPRPHRSPTRSSSSPPSCAWPVMANTTISVTSPTIFARSHSRLIV